jgi:hypothetical protein
MHMSLKEEGTQRGTLAGIGGQKEGMFGESTGPVDSLSLKTGWLTAAAALALR